MKSPASASCDSPASARSHRQFIWTSLTVTFLDLAIIQLSTLRPPMSLKIAGVVFYLLAYTCSLMRHSSRSRSACFLGLAPSD
ncbi:hypothetical protein H4582DRAFT_2014093 [Lactarius indigo]|nr:hypothetical protein H4582DRAFT_2014093 [Lactarius indigo]